MKEWNRIRMMFLTAVLGLGPAACRQPDQQFDTVLQGGRVIDPESGLDAVRNVGIRARRIEAVSEKTLSGDRVIDVSGLVVTPGFIDLHEHGQTEENYAAMVQDGVTSAFELEIGTADVNSWYREREPGQLVNYGVSIGHIPIRGIVMGVSDEFPPTGAAAAEAATEAQIQEMKRRVEEGLAQGAVAVGFMAALTPGASAYEYETLLRVAAQTNASAHFHVGQGLQGLTDAIEEAAKAGASLHVLHVNSSGKELIAEYLEQIELARSTGQDVTTEAYPYEAGMGSIQGANYDDWKSWADEEFEKLQWVETGEQLDRESFARYHQMGGLVLAFRRTEEMTKAAIVSPLTMIASDGFLENGKGHPRTSGTYSKVLGKYVREKGELTLMDALRKMTIEPARRLERRVPAMGKKGRVQEGADADLTVFDPESVIDRATYANPALPSEGIEYVFVNGELAVEMGALRSAVRSGRAIRAEQKSP